MSFNLDDPLAGILSDGSDDSFFDDDILGKKKQTKKKTTPIAEKKNALFDLGDGDKPKSVAAEDKKQFDLGLSDSKKTVDAPEVNRPAQVDISKSPLTFKRTLSKESIKFNEAKPRQDIAKSPDKTKVSSSADKLDLIGEHKLDKIKEPARPALEKGKSSQSLLDDILGGSLSKAGSSSQVTRPATAAKSQDFDLDSLLGKSESKPTLSASKPGLQKTKPKETPKEEKPVRKPKSNDDWLGIFGAKDQKEDEKESDMPAWLMGDSKIAKPEDDAKIETETTREIKEHRSQLEKVETQNKEPELNTHFASTQPIASSTVFQGSTEDITTEGAALYLQQQESQLMVALQLKAQEERLAAMQTRQKETQKVQREAALAQHAQLDAMLRRQADQRLQMQSIIAAHQERITQRIKNLLNTNVENEEESNNAGEVDYPTPTVEKRDTPHTKEKKQLLQLVQSLQENHDKEIDLMETSYRRQLAFLEVSINQSEERMKEESDKLVRFYTEKIGWLEEHHSLYRKMTEDNMSSLAERHRAENEMLRQQHLDNVKVLQEHHVALMENIKSAVKQEHALIKDSASFSSDLHELVVDVKESKNQCQDLVEKVQALTENSHRDTERSLQMRETQVNDMIEHLKKERDNFDIEKSDNREMIKLLEMRLKQMTAMIEEESASMKQKKMEFEFEKATFSKQTEFAKNVLKKQDDEMKMLKDEIQREYKEKIEKIDEERSKAIKDSAAVAKEKASIQSLKQELEKTKAELQAQLEEVTEERSRLNLEKQQLHMEEQRVLAKSRDLDLLAKTAIEKQTQGDKKYAEAEFIQKKYEDRIRRMQEHVVSLNAREKQIAKEKVALSRERLTIHNERKQIESNQQCSLCKTSQNIPAYNFDPYLPDTFQNVSVSRDYASGNMNSALNAVEDDMAQMMGRSFSMRHGQESWNVGNRFDLRPVAADSLQTSQGVHEPGAFKDYMDPKFMMLRLDVQQVLSNLDQNKKDGGHEDDHSHGADD